MLVTKALGELGDQYTLPLRYRITSGDEGFRQMTLPHPSSQMRVCEIYLEYADLITYYCTKSSFSLRFPSKISSSFFRRNPLADLNKYRDSTVTPHDKDGLYRHPSSYFVYGGINKYYKYFYSDEFYDLEKRFSYMLRLDVSKCFPSIYTHTVSWAVKDIDFGKNNVRAKSFGNELDSAMQRMNYNETSGIPVGPEFSRIFAEIILQSVDVKIKNDLQDAQCIEGRDYVIRRYIDDFFVFCSDRDMAEHIRMLVASKLADVNLHFNNAKTELIERPFQTKGSSIVEAGLAVLEEFWRQNTRTTDKDGMALSYAIPIKNHNLLAKSLIRSIKTVCHENKANYSSLTSVLTAAIDSRIQRVIDSHDRGVIPSALIQNQIYLLMALLEVSCFLYGVNPTVPASYKLGRSIILATRFVERNYREFLPIFSEHLIRQCSGFLNAATETSLAQSGVVPIEQIDVLVCLTELPNEYFRTLTPLVRKMAAGVSDYFSLINVLFVAGRTGLLPALGPPFYSKVTAAVTDKSRPHRKAEDLFKLFDLLSCPHLSLDIRQRLVQGALTGLGMSAINKVRREAIANDFEQNPWFTRWGSIDLLREITRRELNRAY
ncbi:RNA-directed DNA polymerase [Devosia sp. MSA67]|uniref:RNA-directed DNA polymerase n=1 Tax=Devosia sediminis TaxID=2798801 RepID=A0A934IX13_9HYPH|nr:RNA-directed DNA polymerase [Devosia sediminis]